MKWLNIVKERYESVVIAILQYLFLLYYLSYADTLFNTDYILIVAFAVLLVGVGLRLIFHNFKASNCMIVVLVGAVWLFLCSWLNGSGFGSAVTQATLLFSICLFSEMQLSEKQQKRMTGRMTFVLSVIVVIFSDRVYPTDFYRSRLPYFGSTVFYQRELRGDDVAVLDGIRL